MATNNQEQALLELYSLARELVSIDKGTDLSEVLLKIVRSSQKALNADFVALYEYDKKNEILKPSVVSGSLIDPKNILTQSVLTESPVQSDRFIIRENIKSSASVPIRSGNEIIGVMTTNYRVAQSFTDEQRVLIELFANQAAIAIKNIRLIQQNEKEGKKSDYFSCFVSHSSIDEEFAKKLHNDLQSNNVQSWFAPADMKIGDRIRSRIDEMIQEHEKLLLVLSKSSISSQWVEQEVEAALEKERISRSSVLLPIRLDDEVMATEYGWAKYIRNTRNIGDFTNWSEQNQYLKNLNQLLKNLKKSEDG